MAAGNCWIRPVDPYLVTFAEGAPTSWLNPLRAHTFRRLTEFCRELSPEHLRVTIPDRVLYPRVLVEWFRSHVFALTRGYSLPITPSRDSLVANFLNHRSIWTDVASSSRSST